MAMFIFYAGLHHFLNKYRKALSENPLQMGLSFSINPFPPNDRHNVVPTTRKKRPDTPVRGSNETAVQKQIYVRHNAAFVYPSGVLLKCRQAQCTVRLFEGF